MRKGPLIPGFIFIAVSIAAWLILHFVAHDKSWADNDVWPAFAGVGGAGVAFVVGELSRWRKDRR